MADAITFTAVGGLVLVGLTLAVALAIVLKGYDRAVRRAEIAERLLAYRQPGSSLRVTRSPLVRHAEVHR